MKLEIQADCHGQYLRILIKGVPVIEGNKITCEELRDLFTEMGFEVVMVSGIFGGPDDDQYDEHDNPVFVPLEDKKRKSYPDLYSVEVHQE